MARSGAPIVAFLMEHCWVQGSFPLLNARTVLRDLLIAGVPAGELAITDADAAALLVVVPSDEDVLAYLDCFLPVFVEERRFIITVRNHPELLSLLDLTEEIMASEKALNWQARGSAQSGDAGSHAQRFRIMKQLNEAVRAALEERERDGLLP